MSGIKRDTRLPRRPQYVKVRLDADMAPDGPLPGGRWPGRVGGVLTYHYFGVNKLRRGDRVCVNAGRYQDVFGTVEGASRRYRKYTYGVRRVKNKTLTFTVEVEKTTQIEVA